MDGEDSKKLTRSTSSPVVDRHGFVVSHRMHSKVSSLPNPSTLGETGKRRELKWLDMIHHWDRFITKHPGKIKERCHKGIPQSVRSLAWQYLSGSKTLKENNPDTYDKLSNLDNSEWGEVILKDIPRTFRHHCMFHEDGSQGQDNLYRVLLAYSAYDPTVGYNQALAPIAAVLLMHMPPDESFWMLVSICKYYLPGYYGEKMEAMKMDGIIFGILLERYLPKISKHMVEHGIDPLMYIVEWMVCMYARCLPFQTVLRIWDMFFCEGVKVLFKVGIAILKIVFSSAKDLDERDDFQTTNILNNLPTEMMVDSTVVNTALEISINERDLEKIHKKVYMDNSEPEMVRFNGNRQS